MFASSQVAAWLTLIWNIFRRLVVINLAALKYTVVRSVYLTAFTKG